MPNLAVASDSGSVLTVAIIGDGAKVHRNLIAERAGPGGPLYFTGTSADYWMKRRAGTTSLT